MSGTPLEFGLRTPDEALHSIGHIVPNADTRHLDAFDQTLSNSLAQLFLKLGTPPQG